MKTVKKICQIDKDRKEIPANDLEILKNKSSIAGVTDNSEKKLFSEFIQKAYHQIEDSFNGYPKIIMKLVASVPDVKIIFLPNESNIHKYREKNDSEFILGGITYAQSERIVVAAKGYDKKETYRKVLGVIIHEFCHFAIHETFGNEYKPFYANDEAAEKEWKKLVNQCYSRKANEFSVIKEIFEYNETKWVDELAVRLPQIFVEHHGNKTYLKKFKKKFKDLYSTYIESVHAAFQSEYEFTTSLRNVNKKNDLRDKLWKYSRKHFKSELKMSIAYEKEMIIETNQIFLIMTSIFDEFNKKMNFKSTFMFITAEFLNNIELRNWINKALQCKKKTYLVVACYSKYEDQKLKTQLKTLLENSCNGKIILIVSDHKYSELRNGIICSTRNFTSSEIAIICKDYLAVNFQGSSLLLSQLMKVSKLNSLESFCEGKSYESLIEDKISIGNHQKLELCKHYIERNFLLNHKTCCTRRNLNDLIVMKEIFRPNQFVLVANETGEGKSTESVKMHQRFKKSFHYHWIVYINLAACNDNLKMLSESPKQDEVKFVDMVLRLTPIENEILLNFLEKGKVIFILESFDRIAKNERQTIIKIMTKILRKNRICIFTRPFVLPEFASENYLEINLEKMNNKKNKMLVENILKKRFKTNKKLIEHLFKKICHLLNLNGKSQTISQCSTNNVVINDFKIPLLVKMTAEVVVNSLDKFPDGIKYSILKNYTYSRYIAEAYFESHDVKIFWKIALENNITYEVDLEHTREKFNEFIENFIAPKKISKSELLNSRLLIEQPDLNYQFVHESFEEFFISQFFRTYCQVISKEEQFLNIFCSIVNNLALQFRFTSLMSYWEGCEEVEVILSKLAVFKQYFERKNGENYDVNIAPVLEELCMKETDFQNKFLIRFSDPLRHHKPDYLNNINFLTLMNCGAPSSANFFISCEDFEKLIERSRDNFRLKDLSLFFKNPKRHYFFFITFSNKKLVEKLVMLNELFLTYQNYRKRFVNDFVSLILNNVRAFSKNLNIIFELINLLKPFADKHFDSELNTETISVLCLFNYKKNQKPGIDHLSRVDTLLDSVQNNMKILNIEEARKIFMEKHNELMRTELYGPTQIQANMCLNFCDFITVLVNASRVLGGIDETDRLEFSSYLRKIYEDIKKSNDELTEIIMKIVANNPRVKIMYLLSKDSERNLDGEREIKLENEKCEVMITLVEGYKKKEDYRKVLGNIIKNFCKFAIQETFGNELKPYYAHDRESKKILQELVQKYKIKNLTSFQFSEQFFENLPGTKWSEELILQYPRYIVEHQGNAELLQMFKKTFVEVSIFYNNNINMQFNSEIVKIAALNVVNTKTLLGDEKSMLYNDFLATRSKIEIKRHRQVIRTNLPFLAMKNIFNYFCTNYNFKSSFMFIDVDFLNRDDHMNLTRLALQCIKIPTLIVNCHSRGYKKSKAKKNLKYLFHENYIGRIILIIHVNQNFETKTSLIPQLMKFAVTDISDSFKGSLKVNFQGCKSLLRNIVNVKELKELDLFFSGKTYENITKEHISIGNYLNFELFGSLSEKYFRVDNETYIELNDDDVLQEIFDSNQCVMIECLPERSLESPEMCKKLKHIYSECWIVHADLSKSEFPIFDSARTESENFDFFSEKKLNLGSVEKEIFLQFFETKKVILVLKMIESFEENYEFKVKSFEKLVTIIKNTNNRICVFTHGHSIRFSKNIEFLKIKMFETSGFENIKLPKRYQILVKRENISKDADDLLDAYKNVLVFLADHSRLFGVKNVDRKDDFTGWVQQIYGELIKNEIAKIIMKIVSCASKVVIIYMPEHDNICDIENTGNAEYIVEGVTFACVEQIIIAAKDYENEQNRDRLKGLIIHEFCHFAVYETFCNEYDAFYADDEDHKTHWIAAMEECKENKNMEKIIEEVFDYPEVKWMRELVVRYFQYQIQYQSDKLKLSEFKKNFSKLCAVCEDYVLENFKDEHEKILAIREINQSVTMSENSPYKVNAIRCEMDFNPHHNTQIIKSNNTALMANYIFYEFEKVQNFKGNYVFLDAKYLQDNIKNFKLAVQRRAKCTFVIDCDYDNFASIESDFKEEIDKIETSKNIIVLLGKHQHFKIKTGLEYVYNFVPSHLTDEFINDIKINFQGQDMSLTDLITVEKFDTFTSLPVEKMHKERILIGNQMELQLIIEYVERKFLIKNQSNDKWEKLDASETIFTKHKRILVANEPGAGKSVESIKMYYRLKEKYSNDWIVHINLSRLVEVFEEEKEKIHTYSDSEKFKILFCRSILNLNEFECDLFELLLESGRVFLIFDSLDEISPFYFSLVYNLAEMIFQTFSEQRIIIFTRPHLVIEMEEFNFVIVKIDEIEENARNDLISNILGTKCARKSEEARNEQKQSVQSFLQKRNFNTPLLIRMVTEVASMKKLNSDEMTLYDIYKHFCDKFDRLQEDRNENIKAEKITLRDIDKYFQKCAIEKLIEHRVNSEVELWNNGRIEISKEDLIMFRNEFFSSLKDPDLEKLQRKGITIHSISNLKEFEFIHASFNDFYVADFIITEIKSLVKSYKNSLMEIFSMLIQESRLNNVIEFLKGHEEAPEYLKEFDVISQMIEDKNVHNGVNIMPVINFIADSIAHSSIMSKICKETKFYTSMILLMDPIKTLEKLCSFKASKSFVYENVLMNRSEMDGDPFKCLYYRPDGPLNILDILAQCGTEDSLEYYVSKDVFAKYFDELTVNHFKFSQIASMMEVLKGNSKACDKFNRSFFIMAKTHNKVVIDTFLNFYETLLEESYFADSRFSNFMSILIFNNESDHERLKILIEKLADLNKKSVRELFSSSKLKLGTAWGNAIRENIKHFRDTTSPEQFEKAINFYVDIFDNGPDGFYSVQQAQFWFRFISSLLDVHLFYTFEIAVNRLADRYGNASAMLRNILMSKDDEDMTILQKLCCFNLNEIDQITDFTFEYYKRIFGCDSVEIRGLFLEGEFFIKLLLAQNDNTQIISVISKFVKKAENETNSWLELMISYSNRIGTNLIDSLLMTGALRKLSFNDKHPELPTLMKEVLQKYTNSQNYSKVIYEIFSNEFLTKDQLSDILDALFLKDDMLENRINQILSYKNPENGYTIIIAASKCKQEGRIEILMEMLESCSDTELFKNCLLSTDNEGKSALFYLLRNKHQENYFLALFDKVESYYTFNRKDLIRDLIYSTKEEHNRNNIFYETLVENEYEVSEEKYKILEKMFYGLSRDEQKKLIFTADRYRYSLFKQVIKQSFDFSKQALILTLNDLFENENLYHKVLRKFKRSSGNTGKFLVSAEVFSSAFNYYKIKGSDEDVINRLHRLLNKSESTSHNLSIGNFQYFREDRVIRHFVSKVNNDKYSDKNERNFMITFIFMLNCDDYIQLLENTKRKIQIQNHEQSKKRTLFSLIKSMKLNIEELEVFFERRELYDDSPFCLYLVEYSYRFLHEFLDFIESMCTNKMEFCKFLASQLSQLKYRNGNNIFHEILLNYEVASDSTMYFDTYETLKIKLGDSKLLNDLHKQTNDKCETPIMLALQYTHIEKCLKFFSENLVETSMKDLLQVKDSLNDISHVIFINLLHTDLESIIKILSNYFEVSDINEMFENSCLKKYSSNRNFIHELFDFRHDEKFVSIKYFKLLFEEMKKRFGIDHLTELILEEDENNKNPLEIIDFNKSIMPYLELIEQHFDRKTIRTLLRKNEGTWKWILHRTLEYNSEENKLFTVQLYKKYFCNEEFQSILRKVFETSDIVGDKLINISGVGALRRLLSRLNSYFEIISDNIHDIEYIKTVCSQVNRDGRALFAIGNFHTSLIHYVYVVKLAEFYFSRDVVKIIFKIEDSTHLVSMFVYAKDYARIEMIELLKEYHFDDWTRMIVYKEDESIKLNKSSHVKCSQKMKVIDVEAKEYGYAIYELLRISINKLSNSERRIEQENNFQGYAIVIHEYGFKSSRKCILCLQAIFSIPRENLSNTRINGLGIEWQYDEKEKKFTNLNGSYGNQEFSLEMINKTCIAMKSDDEHVEVLVTTAQSRSVT